MVKDVFYYYKDFVDVSSPSAFQCTIRHICTESQLYTTYAQQFKFPYFGYNWDALIDCLCELDGWIQNRQIVIIHQEMPRLEEVELRIYIRVLNIVYDFWQQYPDVLQMKIYFPECYKEQIGKILQDINSRLAMEQSLIEPPKVPDGIKR